MSASQIFSKQFFGFVMKSNDFKPRISWNVNLQIILMKIEIPSIYSAYEKYAPIHPFSRFPVDTILVLFILSLTICDGNKLHINEVDIQRVVEYTFKQEEIIGELEVQLHLVGVDLAIWVDFWGVRTCENNLNCGHHW